ncbi:MAG TPA: hypothetical protein VKY33_05425 [Flavobacterium sp.]|nr:hypothetical protein [Flavobacterium sp.]
MSLYSYHIVKTSTFTALRAMILPLNKKIIKGLVHAEVMSVMTLGSSIYSVSRIFNNKIVFFAQWENEDSLNQFLNLNRFGKKLAKGWHVRLVFVRQWGEISGFNTTNSEAETVTENEPIVAVTIARMKYTQIPRFIRWGKPVEKLVRDHPGATLSLASIRYPNVISTFSIWKTQKEMTDMVFGHSKIPKPKRHIDAMKERNRKDFHFEFTTLRFKPVAEFGIWNNTQNHIPSKKEN